MILLSLDRRQVLGWLLSSLVAGICHATDNVAPGRLLFVNAVGGDGKAFIEVGESDLRPAGFDSGKTTGWMDYQAKNYTIIGEHDPFGVAKHEVVLNPSSKLAMVLHAAKVKSEKPNRPPVQAVAWRVIDIGSLKSRGTKVWFGLSLCAKPVELEVSGDMFKLEPSVEKITPLKRGDGFLRIAVVSAPTKGADKTELQAASVTINMEDRDSVGVIAFNEGEDTVKLAIFDLN